MAPQVSGNVLRPHEEEWRDIFKRLSERFPTVSGQRIAQALRDHRGHAGEAARVLRDLTSSDVKEADPDDVEHVATLLSSPAMFKHACKEHFRKFDVNRDGCLEWEETKNLVHAIYEEFGLPVPSEGSLRAFFFATDANQDGVLSEREFRKFFEMFLRYAFFDHLKLRQMVEKGQAIELERRKSLNSISEVSTRENSEVSRPSSSSETVKSSRNHSLDDPPKVSLVPIDAKHASDRRTPKSHQHLSPVQHHRHSARRTPKDGQSMLSPSSHGRHGGLISPKAEKEKRRSRRDREHERGVSPSMGHSSSAPNLTAGKLLCLAPQGVAYRGTPAFQDRTQTSVSKGEAVEILEHWVRTPDGWLPMSDPSGRNLFEGVTKETSRVPHHAENRETRKKRVNIQEGHDNSLPETVRSVSQSPIRRRPDAEVILRPEEQDWKPIFDRLCERFPNVGVDKITQALRENDGHAGKAAQLLRYM